MAKGFWSSCNKDRRNGNIIIIVEVSNKVIPKYFFIAALIVIVGTFRFMVKKAL